MTTRFGLGLAILAASSGACSSSRPVPPEASPMVLTADDSGRSVTVRLGAPLVVRLAGNPTTGYRWELRPSADPVLAQQGDSDYVPDPAPAGTVGSGGTEVWTFKGVRAGRQTLALDYRRPWETGQAPARSVTYTVTVR